MLICKYELQVSYFSLKLPISRGKDGEKETGREEGSRRGKERKRKREKERREGERAREGDLQVDVLQMFMTFNFIMCVVPGGF